MGAYEFTMFKCSRDEDDDDPQLAELIVSAHHDVAAPGRDRPRSSASRSTSRATSRTGPPTTSRRPRWPSGRARSPTSTTRSRSRSWAARRSRRPAWARSPASRRAAHEEPQLITLRYDGPDASGPVLGYVGKAVTFDSGGISIKPGNKMSDMKFDMSGGAAVLGATAAIARLELPVQLDRRDRRDREPPVRPLGEARRHPARPQRHDDRGHQHRRRGPARARRLPAPRGRAGRRAARRPRHAHRRDRHHARHHLRRPHGHRRRLVRGGVGRGPPRRRDPLAAAAAPRVRRPDQGHATATSSTRSRTGAPASVTAAEFLKRFVGDVPWAHLDIAGVAWDTDKAYAPKGGTGYGVRLLVDLASLSAVA